jgi:hypothetical protein
MIKPRTAKEGSHGYFLDFDYPRFDFRTISFDLFLAETSQN